MFVATAVEAERATYAGSTPLREGAGVLALMEATAGTWPRLASVLRDAGSALAVAEGRATVIGRDASRARALAGRVDPDELDDWASVLRQVLDRSPGTRFVPVTSDEYPGSLAELADCPPFLFVRSQQPLDALPPTVAVVGSRASSPEGRLLAREVAAHLARTGSTVVSGLALGIDAEAHAACLQAGAPTVASLPSGVDRIYPEEHKDLAGQIARQGALVSRFWPDAPPRRDSFRLRNAVTSGIAVATVVIEAGPTSGARMQARIAAAQGRPVILMGHLVRREPWARKAAGRRGMLVAESPEEVAEAIRAAAPQVRPRQLALF